MLLKFWAFMNGKKVLVGLIITFVAYVVGGLPLVLPLFGLDAVIVAKIVGIGLTIVGGLHKVYKYLYGIEHD